MPIQPVVHFQLCIMTVIQKLSNQHYDVHKIGDEKSNHCLLKERSHNVTLPYECMMQKDRTTLKHYIRQLCYMIRQSMSSTFSARD